MDRLSGIYKRFAQYFLLALGLVIAVTLNIDSVHMATALWEQPALRAQIIAQVQAQVPPSGTSPATGVQTQGASTPKAADPDLAAVRTAIKQVQSLPLPVGRGSCASVFGEPLPDTLASTTPAPTKCPKPGKYAAGVAGWIEWALPNWLTTRQYTSGWHGWNEWTLLGWLITGFAISLGAPFWFGLLQNIMNLRAAGAPPQRADAQTASS